jgi:predicted phage terminase large subunit-like protein
MTVDVVSPWEAAARLFEPAPPRPRRWASPLDMACDLDRTVVRTPALECINRELVALAEGRDGSADRLLVAMAPQEGKSTLCSKWFPLWLLEHDPDLRIAIVSYSAEMARGWGSEIKDLVESNQGQDDTVDLGLRLREDTKAAGRWRVAGHLGGVYCVGIAGSLTGKPVDILIFDDPIKDLRAAQSPAYREVCQKFWQGTAIPRLGPTAKCLLIQTRWHEEDMAGWLLAREGEGDRAQGGYWKVMSIPAIAEDNNDPLGRKPGEPMISARGQRDWARIRKSVGEYVFGAVYQQRPSPAEGNIFKRLHWRYFRIIPGYGGAERLDLAGKLHDLRECWRFATVDLANSTKTSADWTVISAWARTITGDLVLLDRQRARIGEADHFAHAKPLVERWRLDTLFVEKSQFGTSLVREATQAGVPIAPLTAETDKLTRALPASAWQSNGRIWLPAGAWWLKVWVDECAAFPTGRNDDQVDTLAYAVRVAITQWAPPIRTPAVRTHRDDGLAMADPFGDTPPVTDWMTVPL